MRHIQKSSVFIACLAACLNALAAAFPNKNGTWDLTDPGAYDGGTVPTDNMVLGTGTYNANYQDWTFAGIWPNGKVVIDLSGTPTRRITLNGTNIMYPYNPGVWLELKSGTYDFSGKATQLGDGNNTRLTFSGGVEILNGGTIAGRSATKLGDHSVIIKDAGTKVYASAITASYTHDVSYNEYGTPDQTGVVVDVSSEAQVYLSGTESFQQGGGWALVRGTNTLVNLSGKYARVGGSNNRGSGLHVTDHASLTHTGSYFILQNAVTGYVGRTVTDNFGTLTTSGSLNLGSWGNNHRGNYLVAGANGTVSLGSVYGKGQDNWLVCSNGAMSVTGACLLDIARLDDGSGIKIVGEKPSFTCGGLLTLNNCTVEWQLPSKPYETSGALIAANSFASSGLKYVVRDITRFIAAIPQTTESR